MNKGRSDAHGASERPFLMPAVSRGRPLRLEGCGQRLEGSPIGDSFNPVHPLHLHMKVKVCEYARRGMASGALMALDIMCHASSGRELGSLGPLAMTRKYNVA